MLCNLKQLVKVVGLLLAAYKTMGGWSLHQGQTRDIDQERYFMAEIIWSLRD